MHVDILQFAKLTTTTNMAKLSVLALVALALLACVMMAQSETKIMNLMGKDGKMHKTKVDCNGKGDMTLHRNPVQKMLDSTKDAIKKPFKEFGKTADSMQWA